MQNCKICLFHNTYRCVISILVKETYNDGDTEWMDNIEEENECWFFRQKRFE